MSIKIVMVLCAINLVFSYGYADDLVIDKIGSSLIGKSPTDVKSLLALQSFPEAQPQRCNDKVQVICKEKFKAYCSCLEFATTNMEKPLEVRTYLVAIANEKIVDYKLWTSVMPSSLWSEPKGKTEKMKLRYFAGETKPEALSFIEELSPYNKGGPQMGKIKIGSYFVTWIRKDGSQVAAGLWCPMKAGSEVSGPLRDCFVHEAAFSAIRDFKSINGVASSKKFNY